MCISCVLLHNKSFQLSNLKCSDLLLITILLFGCAIVLLVSPGFTHTVAFRRGVSGLELDFPAHSLSPTRGLVSFLTWKSQDSFPREQRQTTRPLESQVLELVNATSTIFYWLNRTNILFKALLG